MDDDELLDEISAALSLENWFEGKTLTVIVGGKFAKLQLVGVKDKPSRQDLKGEPE